MPSVSVWKTQQYVNAHGVLDLVESIAKTGFHGFFVHFFLVKISLTRRLTQTREPHVSHVD